MVLHVLLDGLRDRLAVLLLIFPHKAGGSFLDGGFYRLKRLGRFPAAQRCEDLFLAQLLAPHHIEHGLLELQPQIVQVLVIECLFRRELVQIAKDLLLQDTPLPRCQQVLPPAHLDGIHP